jgi:hypothetical protein
MAENVDMSTIVEAETVREVRAEEDEPTVGIVGVVVDVG